MVSFVHKSAMVEGFCAELCWSKEYQSVGISKMLVLVVQVVCEGSGAK